MGSQIEAAIPKRTFRFSLKYLFLLVFLVNIDIFLFHYSPAAFVFVTIGIISLVIPPPPIEATRSRKKPFKFTLKYLLLLSFLVSLDIFLFRYSPISFVAATVGIIILLCMTSPIPFAGKLAMILLLFPFIFSMRNHFLRERSLPFIICPALTCIAKNDIPIGTKINSDHITYRLVPFKYRPSNAYFWRDRSQLFGLISTKKIKARDYVMDNQFRKQEAQVSSALHVKQNYRAMSIPISKLGGVSGLCHPGDKIDLVATFKLKNTYYDKVFAHSITNTKTMTVLPNVLILALDQSTGKYGEPINKNYETATLSLTPLEGEVLTFYQSKGATFTFLLRNPAEPDKKTEDTFRKIRGEKLAKHIYQLLRFH